MATVPRPSGSYAVQGAGSLGGIGILVDVEGDDRYEIERTQVEEQVFTLSANGQGHGMAGVGILADLDGGDSYLVANTAPHDRVFVRGQGFGELGGVGLLVDRGTGDDTYLIESRPTLFEDQEGSLHAGESFVEGLGSAVLGGVGLVADGGGRDTMTIRARTAPVGPEDPRPLADPLPNAWARGFGRATGQAAGVALTGDGPTTWTATADVAAPQVHPSFGANVQGFGYGVYASFAALDDGGGDDRYVATATADAQRRVVAEDGCGCPQALEASAVGGPAYVVAGGVGSTQGAIGMLGDHDGDDRYLFSANSVAEARALDDREDEAPTASVEPATLAAAIAGWASGVTQGGAFLESEGYLLDAAGEDLYSTTTLSEANAEARAPHSGAPADATAASETATIGAHGYGGVLGGSGEIADLQGDDRYETTTISEARAEASAPAADRPSRAEASSGMAESRAHAFGDLSGNGHLRDSGGSDSYTSVNISTAEADPPTLTTTGPAFSRVQGAVLPSGATLPGTAQFLDVDGGASDVFDASPPNPTCLGERGGAYWQDCGFGMGVGATG